MTGPDRAPFDGLRTPPDGAGTALVWTDDAPVDPHWAEPTEHNQPPEPDQPRGRRRLIAIGIPVLAVVVLVGAVFAFGGFKQRNDTITDVELGQTFTNGPYELSFSSATVQQTEGFGKYKRIQKVIVTGRMRNNADTAASPNQDWFLARGVRDSNVQTGDSCNIGKPDQFGGPQDVTPGVPPVQVNVQFEFPPTFKQTELVFGMRQLSYGTHSYTGGTANQYWDASGSNLFRLRLHLKRLAAEQY